MASLQIALDRAHVVSRGVLRGRLIASGVQLERARVVPVLRVVADGRPGRRSEGEAVLCDDARRQESRSR